MKFIKLSPFLLLFFLGFSAIAQKNSNYQKFTTAADSLTKIKNRDPLLQSKLASLYFKMHKPDNAERFLKLAVGNGADQDRLLADTSLTQLTDKTRWIDDYRKRF
jgi:predicted Zn-dependent protease